MPLVMSRTITYGNRIHSGVIATGQFGLLASNRYACPYCAKKVNVKAIHMMFGLGFRRIH
jgi:hypothetical protein